MEKVNQGIEKIKENLSNGKCLVNLGTDVMEANIFVIKDNKLFTCILNLDDKYIYDWDNENFKISYEEIDKKLFEYDIQIADWFKLLEIDYKRNLLELCYI